MFVIGKNECGNLGINHFDAVQILTPFPKKKFQKHFQDNSYTIYTDDNYDNVLSTGYNFIGN